MKKWPVTQSERDAAWDYVLTLRERCGDEAVAVAEAVRVLAEGGFVVSTAELLACRPKRKGADTHVDDIGRALLEGGGADAVVDGRVEVERIRITEVGGRRAEDGDRRAEDGGDMEFAADVLQAFFQKLLPEIPSGRVKAVGVRYLAVPAGGRYEAVSVSCLPMAGDGFFVEAGEVPGCLLVRMDGRVVPTLRGAVRVLDADGVVVRTVLNATVKWGRKRRDRPGLHLRLLEWGLGKADWEAVTKQLVTYASMFAPGVVGRVTGAELGRLLGLTRAAVSMRRKKVAAEYKAVTGGQASFPGMRARKDPRKGKKLGRRVKVGDGFPTDSGRTTD